MRFLALATGAALLCILGCTPTTTEQDVKDAVADYYLYKTDATLDDTHCAQVLEHMISSSSTSTPSSKGGCFDRFTNYTPKQTAKAVEGSIGVHLQDECDIVLERCPYVITGIKPFSPAERAGLRANDRLVALEIDGARRDLRLPIDHLKLVGPVGSPITLWYTRAGVEHRLTLTRAALLERSVYATAIGDVCYVAIDEFTRSTGHEFEEMIDRYCGTPVKIALDLRDNLGGKGPAAFEVLYNFSDDPDRVMLTAIGQTEKYQYTIGHPLGSCWSIRLTKYCAAFFRPGERIPKAPGKYRFADVAILVNGGTVSAAEIVAGVLQDWAHRELRTPGEGMRSLFGSATFGKRFGQHSKETPNGGTLLITASILQYGYQTNTTGDIPLIPDQIVAGARPYLYAPPDKDPVLRAALDWLRRR